MKETYGYIVALALALGVASTASADPYPPRPYYGGGYAPATLPSARVPGPGAVLREGVGKLTTFLGSRTSADPQKVLDFLQHDIASYFDFGIMARLVAGPAYGRMSAVERAQLQGEIENLFLTTLVKRLSAYDKQQVTYTRTRFTGPGQANLGVLVTGSDRYPTRLNFRMTKGDDGWRVYDVSANGTSAVAYYRNNLGRTLRGGRFN